MGSMLAELKTQSMRSCFSTAGAKQQFKRWLAANTSTEPKQVQDSRSGVSEADAEQHTSQTNGGLSAVNNMLLYSSPDRGARAGGRARSARPGAAETLWQVWQGFKAGDGFHCISQHISRRLQMFTLHGGPHR